MAGITQFHQNVDLGPSHFQVFNYTACLSLKHHRQTVSVQQLRQQRIFYITHQLIPVRTIDCYLRF